MTKHTFIEPRNVYDEAIVRGKKSKPVYSYYKLVLITFVEMGLDTVVEAVEWVDYNMLSLLDDDQIKYIKSDEKELMNLIASTGEEDVF